MPYLQLAPRPGNTAGGLLATAAHWLCPGLRIATWVRPPRLTRGAAGVSLSPAPRSRQSSPPGLFMGQMGSLLAVAARYVHTDGELSICERIGSSPSVGTISTGVNKEVVLKKYIDDYLAASKPLCENCWAYNICPMCYSECYSQNGVNIKEKSSKCKNCRTYTYLMLGTFCTLMEERPEIMETLNHTVSV